MSVRLLTVTTVVLLSVSLGGCGLEGLLSPPVVDPRPSTEPGDPRLAGTWAMSEFDDLLGLFTFDEGGRLVRVCWFFDFADFGIDSVIVDGQPHSSGIGITTIASAATSSTDLGSEHAVLVTLDLEAMAGPLTIAELMITLGGVLDSADTGTGTLLGEVTTFGDSRVIITDVVATRISSESESCLADDMHEPNDSADQATPVPPGTYPDLRAFNDDWYRIDVAERQAVTARIDFNDSLGDLDLFLYDTTGIDILGESSSTGDVERIELPQDAGSYLLLVRSFNDKINPLYSLTVQALEDDAFEDNDAMESATLIDAGLLENLNLLDDDWFRIVPPTPSAIDVTIQFEGDTGDLELELYSSEGFLVDSSTSNADSEHVAGVGSNEYFIRVYGYAGARNSYTLDVRVQGDDTFEDNDAMESAALIDAGLLEDLNLLDDDWFRIVPPTPSAIDVAIQFEDDAGDLDLELYSSDGLVVDFSTSVTDSEHVAGVGSGEYFIRVYGYSGATNAYTMEVTLTPSGP